MERARLTKATSLRSLTKFAVLFFLPTLLIAIPNATLTLKKANNNLVISGQLSHPRQTRLREALQKGVTYTLTLEWKAQRNADAWYALNDTVFEEQEQVILRYNQTNKSYVVTRGATTAPFFDFAPAWNYARAVNRQLPIGSYPKGTYLVMMRARGESLRLYFPLDAIYRNFVSELDFSLDWAELEVSIP